MVKLPNSWKERREKRKEDLKRLGNIKIFGLKGLALLGCIITILILIIWRCASYNCHPPDIVGWILNMLERLI